MSTVSLDKVSTTSPALKLPQLFSLTPNSSGKSGNLQKKHVLAPQTNQIDIASEKKLLNQMMSNTQADYLQGLPFFSVFVHELIWHSTVPMTFVSKRLGGLISTMMFADGDNNYVQNLKRSVREAALSIQPSNPELSRDSQSDEVSEHFFVPLSTTGFYQVGAENKVPFKSKRMLSSPTDASLLENHVLDCHAGNKFDGLPDVMSDLESLNDFDQVNGFLSATGVHRAPSAAERLFYDVDESRDQVFSPPLLMETSLLGDSYEDLLGKFLM